MKDYITSNIIDSSSFVQIYIFEILLQPIDIDFITVVHFIFTKVFILH